MPQFVGMTGGLNVSGPGAFAELDGDLEVTNPDRPVLEYTVDTLNDALDAFKAQFKNIWISVYVDQGSGVPTLVSNAEIAADLTIQESLDGWADQLSIGFIGTRWSPWLTSLIRGKRKIEVWIRYGRPGAQYEPQKPIFSGYVMSGEFSHYPPVARVNCLDAAALYSETKVNFSIPVNSKKTRLSILMDMLNLAPAVPVGLLDIGGDGGTYVKTFSTPPDARRFDVIRDFLTPVGAMTMFAGGYFRAFRYDPNATIQKVLTKQDIAVPFNTQVPDTTVADQIRAVTVKFEMADTLDTRTEVIIDTIRKDYTPASAVKIQLTDGSVIAFADPQVMVPREGDPPFQKIVTTRTYRGQTLMFERVQMYTWFSPKMSRQWFVSGTPDTVQARTGTNIYQYPDGSWRKDPHEIWQLVSQSDMFKDADANNFIFRKTENQYFYHQIRTAVFQVDGSGTSEVKASAFNIYLDENGDGFYLGQETIGLLPDYGGSLMLSGVAATIDLQHPDSSKTTEWTYEADGAILTETVTDLTWGGGFARYSNAPNAYRYGIKRINYWSEPREKFDGSIQTQTTTYRQVDEQTYTTSETTIDPTGQSIRKTSSGTGSRPHVEKIQPNQSSQELVYTFRDDTRIFLNGVVQEEIHNEFAQNIDELRTVALTKIRQLSAFKVTIPMPIEGQIHKGMTIACDIPEIGVVSNKPLFVWNVQRTFGAFKQTVMALYYPPEVAVS
jgi:hypothetical protein